LIVHLIWSIPVTPQSKSHYTLARVALKMLGVIEAGKALIATPVGPS
jgi:hypothetical protein